MIFTTDTAVAGCAYLVLYELVLLFCWLAGGACKMVFLFLFFFFYFICNRGTFTLDNLSQRSVSRIVYCVWTVVGKW